MEHEGEILDLILSSAGKAAPYITERLRNIGDGKMSEGIHALVEFAAKSGIEIGEKIGLKKGIAIGIAGTVTVAGVAKAGWDIYRKRAERIYAIQEVDHRMEMTNTESDQDEADKLDYDKVKTHKDEEEEN